MSFIKKTLGGLSKAYYIRNFLFGLPIYAFFMTTLFIGPARENTPLPGFIVIMLIVTGFQFLYPYSRYVYESVVDYIMGDTVFFSETGTFIWLKLGSIVLCWVFSLFIAPLGLIYLYFYHTKKEKTDKA